MVCSKNAKGVFSQKTRYHSRVFVLVNMVSLFPYQVNAIEDSSPSGQVMHVQCFALFRRESHVMRSLVELMLSKMPVELY